MVSLILLDDWHSGRNPRPIGRCPLFFRQLDAPGNDFLFDQGGYQRDGSRKKTAIWISGPCRRPVRR